MVEVLEALAELRDGLVSSFFPGVVCLWGAALSEGWNGYMHIDAADSPRPAGARELAERASGNMMYVILWQHNKDEPMFNHRIFSRYLGIDDEVPRMEYLCRLLGFAEPARSK